MFFVEIISSNSLKIRGVFRTVSNNYDEDFLQKTVNSFWLSTLVKILHDSYLTGFDIGFY